MNKTPSAWSYSSITLFDQCPLKYYKLRIEKQIVEPKTEAIIYGEQVHKAAELHIKDGTPVPEKFAYTQPYLDKLKALPGNKLTEHKLGLRIENGKIVPCGFFAQDVWFRGVVDLLSLDNENDRAFVIDYKTSASSKYADDLQLKLMAAAVFLHFGHIHTIRAGLLFLVAKDFIKREYDAKQKLTVFAELDTVLQRRAEAYRTGVFNPKQNFTCKGFCPILDCKHNGRR